MLKLVVLFYEITCESILQWVFLTSFLGFWLMSTFYHGPFATQVMLDRGLLELKCPSSQL